MTVMINPVFVSQQFRYMVFHIFTCIEHVCYSVLTEMNIHDNETREVLQNILLSTQSETTVMFWDYKTEVRLIK